MNTISREELQTLMSSKTDLVLLEALGEQHYASGHLPGARLFPYQKAKELAASVLPDKQVQVVVYCANAACQNSHLAATALAQLGYPRVRVYAEGKAGWTEAGLPLER